MPILESVATAVPEHRVPQEAVKERAAAVLRDLAPELLPHLKVFDSTGIRHRHFARDLDWFLEAHGWAERSQIYREEGLRLLENAARLALEDAGCGPADVGGIVFVSTTGIATPSLDARLLNRLPFASSTLRVPVWGLGCAGGVAGLRLATDLARAHPHKRFLLLSLELCSLSFQLTNFDLRAFVAATLFSDGAAAALVSGDDSAKDGLGRLGAGASHQWPSSEDVMGWDVVDDGLSVVFSREIPRRVESDFAPVVNRFLDEHQARPDRYVLHPGGTKVLRAFEAALNLPAEAFADSAAVLRDYGNMSSPTVLFTLKESLRRGMRDGETALLGALGPGFASELQLLEA